MAAFCFWRAHSSQLLNPCRPKPLETLLQVSSASGERRTSALFLPYRTLIGECATAIMTFRERVEALSIRPIAHISHGANPSLKIHLLPNAGTDRNGRSFEYLAAPTVDQWIVCQCSSFLLSSNCFFTSPVGPFHLAAR